MSDRGNSQPRGSAQLSDFGRLFVERGGTVTNLAERARLHNRAFADRAIRTGVGQLLGMQLDSSISDSTAFVTNANARWLDNATAATFVACFVPKVVPTGVVEERLLSRWASGNTQFLFQMRGSDIGLAIRAPSAGNIQARQTSGAGLVAGRTYTVVATWSGAEGGNHKFWINGRRVTTASDGTWLVQGGASSIGAVTADLIIGCDPGGGQKVSNALLAGFAVAPIEIGDDQALEISRGFFNGLYKRRSVARPASFTAGPGVTAVQSDRPATYAVQAAAQQDQAAAYAVQAAAQQDLLGTFTVVGTSQADRTATYAIQAAAQVDQVATYAVQAAAQRDLAAVFGVLGAAQADRAATYAIQAAAQVDRVATYAVQAAAQRDLSGAFVVVGSAQQDQAAAYVVQAAAQQDLTSAFDVLAAGTATQSLVSVYTIASAVQSDRPAAYSLQAAVQRDQAAAYAIQAAAQQDLLSTFTVVGTAQADRTAEFIVLNAAQRDLAATYTVFGSGGTGASAAEIAEAVWQRIIESGLTAEQMLRIIAAPITGTASGIGTATETYYSRDGTKPRVVAEFDAQSNRTSVTVDGSP